MKTEKPPWSEAALMICTKCATRVGVDGKTVWTADWAEKTKSAMKAEMREKSLAKNLRVMTCSCLGLCPPGNQTVLLHQKLNTGDSVELLVFNPEENPNELKQFVDSWAENREK